MTKRAERPETAYAPRMTADRHREKKNAISKAVEIARGVREPSTPRERWQIEWASPKKCAEQKALTGDYRMPRIEAIRRNASLARQSYGYRTPRTAVKKIRGRWVAIRTYAPSPSARLTSEGRRILSMD